MTRYIFQKLALIAFALLLFAVFAGAVLVGLSGSAAAQDANATAAPNGSATTTPTGTIDATTTTTATEAGAVEQAADAAPQLETDTPDPIAGSVGPIDILDYQLRDGTMTLTLRVEENTAYAVSDSLAGLQQEGVSEVPMKQGTLAPGRQTLSLSVYVMDDAGAVTLSTPSAAVRIQSEPVSLNKDPVNYQTVQTLVAGSAIFGAAGVFYWVRRKRNEEEHGPERVL